MENYTWYVTGWKVGLGEYQCGFGLSDCATSEEEEQAPGSSGLELKKTVKQIGEAMDLGALGSE